METIAAIATKVFALIASGNIPQNLLALVQGVFQLISLGAQYLPTLENEIQVIIDAVETLIAGKNLSAQQIAGIDASFENVNKIAAAAEDEADKEAGG